MDKAAVRGHVMRWCIATRLQHDRASSAQDAVTAEIDVELYAMALAQLLKAANMAKRYERKGGAIARGLATFDEAAADHKHVRDVLVHFDRYERGTGKLQAERGDRAGTHVGSARVFEWSVWFEQSMTRGDYAVNIGLPGRTLTLRLAVATVAAEALANVILDSLSD